MKKLIIAILLIGISCATYAQKVGYLVSVETWTLKVPYIERTQDTTVVNSIVSDYAQLNFTVEKNMKNTNYFVMDNGIVCIVVERKQINKNGKYRRIKTKKRGLP